MICGSSAQISGRDNLNKSGLCRMSRQPPIQRNKTAGVASRSFNKPSVIDLLMSDGVYINRRNIRRRRIPEMMCFKTRPPLKKSGCVLWRHRIGSV